MPALIPTPRPPHYTAAYTLPLTRDSAISAVQTGTALSGADLSGADLSGACLARADLRGADLTEADLRGADLTDADLRGADLTGADLTGADLQGADLQGADLTDAALTGADLRDAYLAGSYLHYANLCRADLRGADLTDADVVKCVLQGTDLRDADLTRTNLAGTSIADVNLEGATGIVPADEENATWLAVCRVINDNPHHFLMCDWHTSSTWVEDEGSVTPESADDALARATSCGTTHCIAGWAQALSLDPAVRAMRTPVAGSSLLPRHAHLFHLSDEEAWGAIKATLNEQETTCP